MNFVGKFDAKLPSDGSAAHWHVEHPSAHVPADAIIVPDAHLLFGADFKRSGVDLILSNADRELVVHDYFKGEHRHPLASPDGAHLTGDIVNALTGQVEYAQAADGSAAVAHVIGHVTKLSGSATAIRNGVSIILNQGDNVEKGDVVQSGSDSTLGVTFIDGTVFGLSSNARMVLNEMVYDPNGSNNSSLISLVAGTISFVAGETAKHGDMKVDTPVATMGIRGTAVLVEIDFNVPGQNGLPDAKFQVLVEPDGSTGSYILFDKTTLDPIATVNKAGQQVNINQNGISYSQSPLTPELQKLITDVFTQKFTDNNNPNTKTQFAHLTDSIVPDPFHSFTGPNGTVVTPIVLLVTPQDSSTTTQQSGPTASNPHIDQAPVVVASSGLSGELAGVTGSHTPDSATGTIRFADINGGDQPTASAAFQSFSYQNALHQEIGRNLTPTEQAAVQAVEVALTVVQDPAGINVGVANWTYSVPDGALDFLGGGETLTLTYLVTVNNNFAQSIKTTTVPITITVTGTNDVPVITSTVPTTIAFDSGTSVPGGNLLAHEATNGTINFDDPDLTDTHTVATPTLTTVTLTSPGGVPTAYVLPPTPQALLESALTASLATDSIGTGHGTISWNLANLPVWLGDFIPVNDVLTLTYQVKVTDSQGASTFQDITVTITGTDAPAEVWVATTTGPSSGGLWSTGANWETGLAPTASDDAIIITNQLEGLTPTYPVSIAAAAAANSLTMDNFGGSAPLLINQSTLAIGANFDIDDHSTSNPANYAGPELDNQGTVTVGGAFSISDHSTGQSVVGPKLDNEGGASLTVTGAFTLGVDAIVDNAGSITVDGKMEVHDKSTVQNSGTITLADGGDFDGQSTISDTATGAIIEVSGGTLNVDVDIANSGTVKVDSSAALTLSAATITGGTVTITGTLTLDGGGVLKDGTLGSSNQINIDGAGNALDNEHVTNSGAIEIMALGALTLDLLTAVGNGGHAITVDSTGTLTLQGGASITGGSLANSGTVDIDGTGATLDGVTVTGLGAIVVDIAVPATPATPTTLVLKDITSVTNGTLMVGPTGILSVAGSATLDHVGVTNQNSIEVTAGNALTLDDAATVDNGLGTITIDGTGTLTLNDASISGGTINDFDASGAGTIDVTGVSTIDGGATLNKGNVTVESATLTLDNVTVSGSTITEEFSGSLIQVDSLDRLTLEGDATIQGTTGVTGAIGNAGTIEIVGPASLLDDKLTNTSAGILQIDDGQTLTLSGTEIAGGTINDFDSSGAGTIDITGLSKIDGNATLNKGNVTVESTTLTLDNVTVNGSTITEEFSGSLIQIDGGGKLTLKGSATIQGASGVTGAIGNAGTIEIVGPASLLNDKLTNASAGILQIDDGQTLTLSGTEIAGGTINDFDTSGAGTIDVTGVSTIDGGATLNKGNVTVESATLTLDNVTVSGSTITEEFSGSLIQVDSLDRLTLEGDATIQGTTGVTGAIGNAGTIEIVGPAPLLDDKLTNTSAGILQIDDGQTLTLSGTEIAGGTINDFDSSGAGTIDITGLSKIDGNATLNKGNVTVESTTLTLDNVTVNGSTITEEFSGSLIQIDGGGKLTLKGSATIQGALNVTGAIGNSGTIEITGLASLLDDKLTNTSAGILQIDDGQTLTLSGTEIAGGTINDFSPSGAGTIDITGLSTIDGNATLNKGNVTVESTTLTLDDVTLNGSTVTEEFSGSSIQISGTLTLEGGAVIQGATIPGGPNVIGAIGNSGTIEIAGPASLLNGKLTNTGTIQVDDNQILTLAGIEIFGGTINDFSVHPSVGGTIDVTGDSTIDGNATLNNGFVTVESAVLTLDNVTVSDATITEKLSGSSLQISGTLTLEGGALIQGISGSQKGAIGNSGTIEIAGPASLLNDTLTNTIAGILQVDDGQTLTLSGTEIAGGTINDFNGNAGGTIDVIGNSTISDAGLNNGHVTLEAGVHLTLDGTTVTGTSFDDTAGGTIQVDAGDTVTLHNVSIAGGTLEAMNLGSQVHLENVTITGGTLSTGDLTDLNSGLITVEAATDGANTSILDGSVSAVSVAGYIQVKAGANLELIGTIHNSGHIEIDPVVGPTGTLEIQGHVNLDSGGTVTLDGSSDHIVAALGGGTLNNYETISGAGTIGNNDGALILHNESGGVIQAINGTLTIDTGTTFINDGIVEAGSGGKLVIDDAVGGSGSMTIDGGTLGIGAGVQTINFSGAGGELQLDAASFGGNIVGLDTGDQIDLTTIGYGLNTTGTYVANANNTGGTLTITDGQHSIALQLVGNYANAHFAGSADSNGDTLITLHADDDLPFFTSPTTQGATVAELANTTNASPSTLDGSTPTGGSFSFQDVDLTDRPTATITSQSVTWTGGPLTTAESNALASLESGFALTPPTIDANTNNGTIAWTYAITDHSLDFLAAGQSATLTSTITLDDHQLGTATATVTIVIDGANDAPVLAADTSGIGAPGLHAIAELAGKTGDATDIETASGTLSFTDFDLTDTHTPSQDKPTYAWSGGTLTQPQIDALTAAGKLALSETDSTNTGIGSIGFTYSAADSSFDFLAAGETLAVTYIINVTDNSGVISSQPVTFTVSGSNDAPVLAADTGVHTIAERAGHTGDTTDIDSASGTLSFTDVDLSDTHKVTDSSPTYVWSGGTLTTAEVNALTSAAKLVLTETDSTHSGTGSIGFTYSAADSTFDFLGAGQTLTVTYDITVTDNHGISSSQPVTFTVTGSNDAPTIAGETNPATQTIILAKAPTVLSEGTTTNSLGLPTETFDELTAGSASNNGSGHASFKSAALGGAMFSGSGDAGVVNGSSSVTAPPFVGPLPGHADATNYLSIGANGSETITFATEQNEFGLYWGSVDSFNTIKFFNGNTLVASYTGADIAPLLANGNQGSFSANGYVEFADLGPFTQVVLASGSSNAFEIDNISAGFSHVQLAGPIDGTLTVNDADIGDMLTAAVTKNAIAEYNGSTTLPSGLNLSALIASGAITFDTVKTTGGQDVLHWTYDPANANLDFLKAGDTLTLTFNAAVSDGHATTVDQPLTITLVGNGSSVVHGTPQNDTFADVGDGVTISGGAGHDIYNFNAHFGSATITDFDVNNDVINVSSTLFASTTALLNSAVGSGVNTVITDSAGEQITLDNVTTAQLKAHPGDFQFAIANGGTFEAGASTSENVVFEGSTGKLTLDTPSSFTGVISGFTGDGTLSGSDQIDLKGIDHNSGSFSESFDATNDTLFVTDGADSATLHFNGTYQAANFKFTTDNAGGTIVYDPPVPANAAANTSANAPAVTASDHGFVFNFAGNGHDMAGGNHLPDTHLFDSHMTTDADAALNKLHDDSHATAPVAPTDSHDPSATKAQWHASDFHFV